MLITYRRLFIFPPYFHRPGKTARAENGNGQLSRIHRETRVDVTFWSGSSIKIMLMRVARNYIVYELQTRVSLSAHNIWLRTHQTICVSINVHMFVVTENCVGTIEDGQSKIILNRFHNRLTRARRLFSTYLWVKRTVKMWIFYHKNDDDNHMCIRLYCILQEECIRIGFCYTSTPKYF